MRKKRKNQTRGEEVKFTPREKGNFAGDGSWKSRSCAKAVNVYPKKTEEQYA